MQSFIKSRISALRKFYNAHTAHTLVKITAQYASIASSIMDEQPHGPWGQPSRASYVAGATPNRKDAAENSSNKWRDEMTASVSNKASCRLCGFGLLQTKQSSENCDEMFGCRPKTVVLDHSMTHVHW